MNRIKNFVANLVVGSIATAIYVMLGLALLKLTVILFGASPDEYSVLAVYGFSALFGFGPFLNKE